MGFFDSIQNAFSSATQWVGNAVNTVASKVGGKSLTVALWAYKLSIFDC
jgi:hypothetical protein